MIKNDDGGPAFPLPGNYDKTFNGMSLRDYFAGMAMQALVSCDPHKHCTAATIAVDSYEFADAMIMERDNP